MWPVFFSSSSARSDAGKVSYHSLKAYGTPCLYRSAAWASMRSYATLPSSLYGVKVAAARSVICEKRKRERGWRSGGSRERKVEEPQKKILPFRWLRARARVASCMRAPRVPTVRTLNLAISGSMVTGEGEERRKMEF